MLACPMLYSISSLVAVALLSFARGSGAAETGLPPGVYHRSSGLKLTFPPRPPGPEVFTLDKTSGVEVRIVDQGGDRVEIYKDGTLVHEHLINEGRTSKVKTELKWRQTGDSPGNYNIALRYGDQLDVYICYAIRVKVITHSELMQFKYQDDFVDRDFSFEWLMNSRFKVAFGNSLDGIVDWDAGAWQPSVRRHY
jgi:hypothetical protein